MRTKYVSILFIIAITNMLLPLGQCVYEVPDNTSASWKLLQDDALVFYFIRPNDIVTVNVYNHTDSTITATLYSTRPIDEEKHIIDFTKTRCFPFVEPTSTFDPITNPDMVIENGIGTWLGAPRNYTILQATRYIANVPYIMHMTYDQVTGYLLRWEIRDSGNKLTRMDIVETTAWEPLPPSWWDLYGIWIIIGLIVIGVTILIIYIVKNRQKLEPYVDKLFKKKNT